MLSDSEDKVEQEAIYLTTDRSKLSRVPTDSLPISALWKFAISSIIDENRAKKAHGRARKYRFQMTKNDRELYLAGLRVCLRKLTLPIIQATVSTIPSSHKKESDMSSKEKKLPCSPSPLKRPAGPEMSKKSKETT